MASGILFRAKTQANANVVCYTVPANRVVTMNMNVINPQNSDATISIWLSDADSPTAEEIFEYQVLLESEGGALERTAMVLNEGVRVVVKSDVDNVVIMAFGFEEEA